MPIGIRLDGCIPCFGRLLLARNIWCKVSFRLVTYEKNSVKFLNYGDDVCFQKPEYFQDASHLNDAGVRDLLRS